MPGSANDAASWAADHQRGALACLHALASEAHPDFAALHALLARPLPHGISEQGLKYDCYRAVGPGAQAWGLTINDRHESRSFRGAVEELVAALGQAYALPALDQLEAALSTASMTRTLGVGYDRPDRPPRLKLYLQEDAWGAGVCQVADVPDLAARLDLDVRLPEWLPQATRVGVVCLALGAAGERGLKLYLGATEPEALARNAPSSVTALARAMRQTCPLGESYHYLTLRLGAGHPRYAINKIYNTVQLFEDPSKRRAAWRDVAELFALASADAELAKLLQSLRALKGIGLAPTATALEGRLDHADVYFAALARSRGTF